MRSWFIRLEPNPELFYKFKVEYGALAELSTFPVVRLDPCNLTFDRIGGQTTDLADCFGAMFWLTTHAADAIAHEMKPCHFLALAAEGRDSQL